LNPNQYEVSTELSCSKTKNKHLLDRQRDDVTQYLLTKIFYALRFSVIRDTGGAHSHSAIRSSYSP